MAHGSFAGIPTIAAAPSDAQFRLHEGISILFDAMGLSKTTDTGQVNWATVTYPGDANYTSAYEIRAFADSMQSDHPVFFKVGYGYSLVGSTRYAALKFTIGSGSDGAGNITGEIMTQVVLMALGSIAAWTGYAGGEESGFAMSFQERLYAGMERMRDKDGALTPYLLFYRFTTNASSVSFSEPTSWLIDLRSGGVVAPGTIPIFYWRDLAAGGAQSLLSGSPLYPFGVIQYPTRDRGVVRNKYAIGCGINDFQFGTLIPVPRFSTQEENSYFLTSAFNFGTGPRGVSTTTDDTQVWAAAFCVYWQ